LIQHLYPESLTEVKHMANWHTLLVKQMKFLGNDDESSVQELLGILDPFDRISFSYNDNLLFGPLEQHNPYNDPRIRRENAPSQYGTSQYCDSDYFDFLDQEGHSVKYYKDSEGDTQFTIEWNEDESLSEIDDDLANAGNATSRFSSIKGIYSTTHGCGAEREVSQTLTRT